MSQHKNDLTQISLSRNGMKRAIWRSIYKNKRPGLEPISGWEILFLVVVVVLVVLFW